VHGGNLKESTLRTRILGISTLTEKGMFGIAAAQAVDRMRDLVRRASLARLCLAAGDSPLWPFDPSKSMDVAFADEQRCHALRLHWHSMLADIGAPLAASHLPAPGDIMRQDYGPRVENHSD
jgi:hypothetical protein